MGQPGKMPTGEEPTGTAMRPVNTMGAVSPSARMALPATFRRGGRVKRTGFAKVHKGEVVVPAKAVAAALGAGKKRARKARKK